MKYYTAVNRQEANEVFVNGLRGQTWLWVNPNEAYYDSGEYLDDAVILEVDVPESRVRLEHLTGQERGNLDALYTRSKVSPGSIKLIGRSTDFAENHENTLDKLVGRPIKFRPEHQEDNVN